MEDPTPDSTRALLVVSTAMLLATSIWFSGTAASAALANTWGLSVAESAWLTISVQLGFILGTFLYALLNLSDIFNARFIFLGSALAGAILNAAFAGLSDGLYSAVFFRFLCGITLAGIYPVGMKLVASWFQRGLGWRLGILVAALTLGKASSYLIQTLGAGMGWRPLVGSASVAAALGGILVFALVPDGPYLRDKAPFDGRMLLKVFRYAPFRYTAFGYFGHMWELYAFWALIQYFLAARFRHTEWDAHVPLLAFLAIGVGALGCVAGGWLSRRFGERKVALISLLVSATLCLTSGVVFFLPAPLVIALILVWGFFVIADSPQFSALAARYCPPEYTGTALTIQNGIGFGVTIFSLQLLPLASQFLGWQWVFTLLAAGPLIGAWFMFRLEEVRP